MKYPILDPTSFGGLRKSAKKSDVDRIFNSPNSEDYVTWNIFSLLKRASPEAWWPRVVELARSQNPNISRELSGEKIGEPELWELVQSPAGYETASRLRMRTSSNPVWQARAKNPKAVEGSSEIDVILVGSKHLIFLEAKLGSDVSLGTTYDPKRNQIVRNIDCVATVAAEQKKTPLFWMLARDSAPKRQYVRILNAYKNHSEALIAELPHLPQPALRRLCGNFAVLLWRDILAVIEDLLPPPDAPTATVLGELRRRVN